MTAWRSPADLSVPDLNHPGLTLMLPAVTLTSHRYDPRMMQKPTQQGGGQRRILHESGIPLAERQVAGNDQRSPLLGSVHSS